MNRRFEVSNRLQYHYLLNTIRKRKRFAKWIKPERIDDLRIVMEYYSMTDEAISKEMGDRLKALRLRKNISQQQLALDTTISLNAIRALETGKAKLTTLIAVLRYLGQLDALDTFLTAVPVSTNPRAKLHSKIRQRASKNIEYDQMIKDRKKKA